MPPPAELAHEAAAVAAFLSDISGFLDEEVDHSSISRNTKGSQPSTSSLPHQNETVQVNGVTITSRKKRTHCPLSQEEEERKRALRNLKTGKRRDAYRKRLKAEWQELRCQEVELTRTLEDMQQARSKDAGGLARSAWRAVAMRQLEGKCVAEAQQETLKAAVKRRREVIQDLEHTLRKRLKEVENARAEYKQSSCVVMKKSRRVEPNDERLFEAYLDELDAIYAKTDDVFRSCEIEPKLGPFINSKPPKKREGDTEYFENLGVLHSPFDFQRTCSALWQVTHQPYRQLDREQYSGLQDIDNTIAVRFRVRCGLQTGGVVSILTHFVARKYVEAARTVIIWRELWEGEGDFEGMHSDETGWCIVQPQSTDFFERTTTINSDALANAPSTLIQTCVRLVPMHFNTNILSEPDIDQFTEVLVTSGKEDNMQMEQMMAKLRIGEDITSGIGERILGSDSSSVRE
ncbi:hypothetical protein PHYBOEH_002560 [Phytophthora boehmeriae]|uniref:Uncharacterized protein n=1 Tax=Phytophthora boehmeriae TaxID=109152 RepID=A0A8T1WQF4_9STRA|nr:hypothetical protein PHYBOEH_002560 [Phytophthora boehmeriae]